MQKCTPHAMTHISVQSYGESSKIAYFPSTVTIEGVLNLMPNDAVGDRIVDVRVARGRKRRPEGLERFTDAMNALLPERERVHYTTVGRWEMGEGRPNVVQGWAIMQLDPERRPLEWLAAGEELAPATRESAGAIDANDEEKYGPVVTSGRARRDARKSG